MGHRLIVVVAKSPEPGRVKTRLTDSGIAARQAADLARAFLEDSLQTALHPSLAADVWLAWDGDPSFLPPLPEPIIRVAQGGGELGERLARLTVRAFEDGYRQLTLVGSDSPHLPVAFLQEAFGRLQFGFDVVIGPAVDGGYYLLGMAEPHPELFAEIPWSTDAVQARTLEIAEAVGLKVVSLPILYDVDTAGDARQLWRDLRRGVAKAPRTLDALDALFDSGRSYRPNADRERYFS